MNKQVAQQGGWNFKVVCVWCGDVMSLNALKNSEGICLRCDYRMLNEHNNAYKQAGKSMKASER